MDRLDCFGCHVNNDSSEDGLSYAQPSNSPEEESGNPPLPAIAFISTVGVACFLSNVLLALAIFGTRERLSRRTKETSLRIRLRGLLLNLAAVDLASVVLLAPFEILILAKESGEWDFGSYCCRFFLGFDVILGSAAAYGVAAVSLYSVRTSRTWPILTFSWLLSASLSVPVFVLADVVSLPSSSGPQFHCSLPLALSPGDLGPLRGYGERQVPTGLLFLRLSGSVLGFVIPTIIMLISNVEAVVRYIRSSSTSDASDEEAVRVLKDECMKLSFVLSLSHVLSTFPRFAYSVFFLFAPSSFPSSSVLRIPPLVSSSDLPTALFFSMLHYAAPAIRPSIIVMTSKRMRTGVFSLFNSLETE